MMTMMMLMIGTLLLCIGRRPLLLEESSFWIELLSKSNSLQSTLSGSDFNVQQRLHINGLLHYNMLQRPTVNHSQTNSSTGINVNSYLLARSKGQSSIRCKWVAKESPSERQYLPLTSGKRKSWRRMVAYMEILFVLEFWRESGEKRSADVQVEWRKAIRLRLTTTTTTTTKCTTEAMLNISGFIHSSN